MLNSRKRLRRRRVTWEVDGLPERLREVPSMLTYGERALLYSLGREVRLGTSIVDAGCFLGGSTAALALGAAKALPEPRALIHSYDLFLVDHSARMHYGALIGDREIGADLRPVFDAVVGDDLLRYVEVHPGDLLAQRWGGGPIDVLFVDVAKTWDLSDHVAHEFFPALVPGRSVVVQQDYIHEWLPWIHITMQLLDRSFTRVAVVPGSPSVVYLCTRAVKAADLPRHLRDLPEARLEQLFDDAIAPYAGEDRSILECARAVMLADFHGGDRAVAHLDALKARTEAPTARFETVWGQVRGWAAALPR
jgi:SAM-dependent methyltransferase